MPNLTMKIAYVNAPKPGKQRGSIKGADDQFLGCFADKLHLFEPGRTYDIEYTETTSNGVTYRNVKSATAAGEAEAAAAVASTAAPQGNGGGYREPSEQIFVCALLKEMIRAGHVTNDKRQLWETTNTLRGLWRATFGEGNTFLASEAVSGKQAARG